ncbi:MAG TPA: alginate export family protein [Caulobacteraceae bacterium]
MGHAFAGLAAAVALGLPPSICWAQEAAAPDVPARPTIMFNRWQEDWSVLANPDVPREPFDWLKYIPLSPGDPHTYLSFGANLRERFETSDAANFGVGTPNQKYDLSRFEAHADLHIGTQVQVFTQIESDFPPGKAVLTPADKNQLDLEQAFVTITEPVDGGTFRLRVGRQEMAFDLQRFIGVRDGANVRQAYDAIWAEYFKSGWRLTGFYSMPVQYRDLKPFDDYSSNHFTFGGARLERYVTETIKVSIAYSHFNQDNVHFLSVSGNERRNILDIHTSGTYRRFDWDTEGMYQTGGIGQDNIRAWAIGSLTGYTFAGSQWRPRLGLQVDAATGDRNPHDHTFELFNPLFPNAYYFTLQGYSTYANLIHVKPSLTLHPIKTLTLLMAAAAQWRETTGDAVYTIPDVPVKGTAGTPGKYTGTYGEFRADWLAGEHVAFALEADHFAVTNVIRRAGGRDGNYLGAEVRFGW